MLVAWTLNSYSMEVINVAEWKLFSAAYEGDTQELTDCVALGFDVNKPWRRQFTALQLAALNWYPECVKALIDAGADVNLTDDEKRSALYYAVMFVDPDNLLIDQIKVIAQL